MILRSSEMRINIRQIARAPLLLYRQQSIGEKQAVKMELADFASTCRSSIRSRSAVRPNVTRSGNARCCGSGLEYTASGHTD